MRIGIFRGPALAYAGAQEYGATIRPVTAKALAIPMDPVKTSAGVDKYGGPRNFPGELRFLPFRRGIAVGKLVAEEDADALVTAGRSPYDAAAMYLLLKEVKIPATHFLWKGVTNYMPDILQQLANTLIGLFDAKQ
jgi:hypothetical protein